MELTAWLDELFNSKLAALKLVQRDLVLISEFWKSCNVICEQENGNPIKEQTLLSDLYQVYLIKRDYLFVRQDLNSFISGNPLSEG